MTVAAAVAKLDIGVLDTPPRGLESCNSGRAGLRFAALDRDERPRERIVRSETVPRGRAARLFRPRGGRDLSFAEPHRHRRAFLRVPGALRRQPPDPL